MQLASEKLEEFLREGYLVVENVFDDADLQPVIDEISAEIDARARDAVLAGDLSRSFEEEGFETRLTRISRETDKVYSSIASGKLHGPGIFAMLTNRKLVDLMESLLGPELIASSVYRIRPKIPGWEAGVVPWHQDSGYFEPFCDRSLIITVWVPLVDATVERGCLIVLPRAHKGEVLPHRTRPGRKYLEIVPESMPLPESAIHVPVKRGGLLMMTNRTPHCSGENTTEVIRWSVDLRYQGADVPTNYLLNDGQPFRPQQVDEPPACYPPEVDFLVRSRKRPEQVVDNWLRFSELRERHPAQRAWNRWQ